VVEQPSLKRLKRLVEAVEATRKNARIEDISRLLNALGFELRTSERGKGSHRVFRKAGHSPITIPAANPVKRPYADMALQIAEEYLELRFGPTWRSDRR
jgi:predicted RNA binding protein YcfA (HicA-like mRNA interferase family)